MKAIEGEFRNKRIDDGYYDGRFSTKSVPNKKLQFLEECDEDYENYLLDTRETKIKPSPHRL